MGKWLKRTMSNSVSFQRHFRTLLRRRMTQSSISTPISATSAVLRLVFVPLEAQYRMHNIHTGRVFRPLQDSLYLLKNNPAFYRRLFAQLSISRKRINLTPCTCTCFESSFYAATQAGQRDVHISRFLCGGR